MQDDDFMDDLDYNPIPTGHKDIDMNEQFDLGDINRN